MSARLVLDNSVSAAWCFSDETNAYTEGVFQAVAKDGRAVAPALWPVELANALVVAERRKRITSAQRDAFLKDLAGLDIEIPPLMADEVFHQGISLAITLALAIQQQLPVATQDEELIRAARDAGVPLFQP